MTIKVALAGAGAFGIKHLDGIKNIDGVEVISLISRDLAKTQEVADKYGIKHVTTDLADALAIKEVDAVILCTPTQMHAEQTIACLKAGKHVQVEIPLADSLKGAEDVVSMQKQTGLVAMCGHTRRFNPSHQYVHHQIQKGEFNIQQMDVQTYFFRRTNTNALGQDDEEKALVRDLFLLTLKPVMYVANVLEDGFENNPHLDAVRARAATEGAQVVPVSAAIEEELSQLDDADRQAFLSDMGMEEPGLNRLIRAAFKLLGLQTYFTAGVKEVRAWTVPIGATAPQAAGVIHTDFERGFIRAQTIAYEDFITYKGEQGAKEAGKMRAEGKEYIVQDGDVMNFLFNV